MAFFSSILNHLYIAVFIFVNLADAQSADQTANEKPDEHKLPVWCLSVNHAVTHGGDQKGDRVEPAYIHIIRCRQPFHDIPENTGEIQKQTKYNADDIGKVFNENSVVHQVAAQTKTDQNQGNGKGNGVEDIPGDRHPIKDQHSHDDHCRNGHFKCVDHYFGDQQDIFGQVDLGNNGFVLFYQTYTLVHGLAEKDPHGISHKNKNGEVGLLCVENFAENECVDQHEAKWFKDPPQPVQIGIGNLGFQL